jgi:hypothetical protein
LTQNNGISVSNMLVDRAAGHVGFWCDRIVIPEHRIAIREPVALTHNTSSTSSSPTGGTV